MKAAQGVEAAREAALRLIERMRRTRVQLGRRLRDKGFESAEVEAVLDRLAAVGLVDDVEYARAFLAGRWGRRAAGWRRLEMELRQRGVSGDDIAAGRARLEADQGGPADEAAMARRVVEQSARRYARLEPHERRRKLWALLARRGFAGDVIAQAVGSGREDADPSMS